MAVTSPTSIDIQRVYTQMAQILLEKLVKEASLIARELYPSTKLDVPGVYIGDRLKIKKSKIVLPEVFLEYPLFTAGFLAAAIAMPKDARLIPEVRDVMFYSGLKREKNQILVELWRADAEKRVKVDYNPMYALPSWDKILGGRFVEYVIRELWEISKYGIKLSGLSFILLLSKLLWKASPPLSRVDIRIVEAMLLDPGASGRKIAKMLGIPKSTVLRRIRKLKERNWLRMHVMVNYPMIGLEHKVLLAKLPTMSGSSIEKAIRVLGIPYTRILMPVYGGGLHVYGAYTIPFHLERAFRTWLKELTRNGILQEFHLITLLGYNILYSFTSYVPGRGWRTDGFGWVMWFVDCIKRGAKAPIKWYSYRDFPLDEIDLHIIRELQKGVSSISSIAESVGVSRDEVSRRLEKLKREEVVTLVPSMAFDGLSEALIMLFKAEERETIESIAAGLTILPCCGYAPCTGDFSGVFAVAKLPQGSSLSYADNLSSVLRELAGIQDVKFYFRWGYGGIHRLLPVEMYEPGKGWRSFDFPLI